MERPIRRRGMRLAAFSCVVNVAGSLLAAPGDVDRSSQGWCRTVGFEQPLIPGAALERPLPPRLGQVVGNPATSLVPASGSAVVLTAPLSLAAECRAVIAAAEQVAEKQGGWSNARHATHRTTDIAISTDPGLAMVASPMVRAAERVVNVVAGWAGVEFHDVFVVKYSAETATGQRELEPHQDASVVSFQLALNSRAEFAGGGTRFEAAHLNCTFGPPIGHAVFFPGELVHSGRTIWAGVRYVLVGFSRIPGAGEHAAPVSHGLAFNVSLGRPSPAELVISRPPSLVGTERSPLLLASGTCRCDRPGMLTAFGLRTRRKCNQDMGYDRRRRCIGLLWLVRTKPLPDPARFGTPTASCGDANGTATGEHASVVLLDGPDDPAAGICRWTVEAPIDPDFVANNDVILFELPPGHFYTSYRIKPRPDLDRSPNTIFSF